MEGATNGSPPCLRINSAISAARRLSSESTRAPWKDMPQCSAEGIGSGAAPVKRAHHNDVEEVPLRWRCWNVIGNAVTSSNEGSGSIRKRHAVSNQSQRTSAKRPRAPGSKNPGAVCPRAIDRIGATPAVPRWWPRRRPPAAGRRKTSLRADGG